MTTVILYFDRLSDDGHSKTIKFCPPKMSSGRKSMDRPKDIALEFFSIKLAIDSIFIKVVGIFKIVWQK
jgi:hypothetical protein